MGSRGGWRHGIYRNLSSLLTVSAMFTGFERVGCQRFM